MAPKESQEAIKEFGRPEYEQMIAGAPLIAEIPVMVAAGWSEAQKIPSGRVPRRR
jgi:hypothetical protein